MFKYQQYRAVCESFDDKISDIAFGERASSIAIEHCSSWVIQTDIFNAD